MAAVKLSEDQIKTHLEILGTWERVGDSLKRSYKLASFPAAILFASTVGHLAEAADHHPDILIQWRTVTLTLSTHSAGGLTALDFALAEQIEALPIKTG